MISKPKQTHKTAHVCVCSSLCTTVLHNKAQNRSDYFLASRKSPYLWCRLLQGRGTHCPYFGKQNAN